MLINACTVILSILWGSAALYDREYTPNVGTVLFKFSDNHKSQWAKKDIGLLRARRHFQNLLPPPVFINSFHEDYVNILLGYFRDSYSAIKRESVDVETDAIMTTALSDAIGGYLKVWVLPVAKLDYYGGTVSQENVVKLFLFYTEIKSFLGTDGSEWRNPNENVLNSVTINVAPKYTSSTRSARDPCENFAFFEKTANGLGIPIPYIYWNEKLSTMFIPLKNVSLIPMSSPNTQTLIKYYDAARSCLQSTNPQELDRFEDKFQFWLRSDVVPHLKDDTLYLPLGSVLTLVNRSQELFNNGYDVYGHKYYTLQKQMRVPNFTSKKWWILSIILLIEVAWCIPALIYILCTKKVHKKDCSSNVYLFIDKPEKKDKKAVSTSTCLKDLGKQMDTGTLTLKPTTRSGLKLFRRARLANMEFEAQYPSSTFTNAIGIGTRSYISSKDQSANAIKAAASAAVSCNEVPRKSSLKKTSTNIFLSDQTNSTLFTPSSQEIFNSCHPDQTFSCATVVSSVKESTPLTNETKYNQKTKREKVTKPLKEDRKQPNESKKPEDRKKSDDSRKLEERKKSDECRKPEERIISEECRRLEESKLNDDFRRVGERIPGECRKYEERKKVEEHRKNDERRTAEECRKKDDRRKTDECRRQEERKKAEELRKQEERRNADELRKQDERKKLEELRKQEERKKTDEIRKQDEYRRHEERKKNEEYRKNTAECSKKTNEVAKMKDNVLSNSITETEKCNLEKDDCDEENYMDDSHNTSTDPYQVSLCSCTGYRKQKAAVNFQQITTEIQQTTSESTTATDKCETKTTRFEMKKEYKAMRCIKHGSGQSYLEIKIDRPNTEICVDVRGQLKQQYLQYRPSKIPKPAIYNVQTVSGEVGKHSSTVSSARSISPVEKRRSLIPQPKQKRKALDDIVLTHTRCSCKKPENNRLNDTF